MKKRRKKLSKLTIISMLIGFLVGFSIRPIMNRINRIEGFISPPFYIVILIVYLVFVLAVTLHELGHAISFIRNGIKIRAIISTNFLLIKEDERWKFKIIGNKGLGGIAVPDIKAIKDEEDFLVKQNSFAKALIAGPIASIIAWVGLTIIGILIINLTTNLYIRSNILVFLFILSFLTIGIIATSFLKNDMVVGDFPAYKIAKNDKYFAAMQFYNYGYFSSNPEKARQENTYLRECIIKELIERYNKRDTHWYTLSMIDTIILEYLSGFLEELPMVVKDYIDYILKSPRVLSDIRRTPAKEIMYFHLIRLLYENEETREKSFELYKDIKNSIKPNTPKRKYLFKQIEHVLEISDNREYLMDERNIVNTDMHYIYKHFPGFFMDEIKLNRMS